MREDQHVSRPALDTACRHIVFFEQLRAGGCAEETDEARVGGIPINVRALRREPLHIGQSAHLRRAPLQKQPAAERGVVESKPNQFPHIPHEIGVRIDEAPVEPRGRVVLAIRVVVALLGTAALVPGEHHRHPLAQQQRGEHVADLPRPNGVDVGPFGRALDPVVIGEAVVVAVAVAFAIGLVVLVAVGDEVVEREAVVRCDEVDAVVGLTAVVAIEVARAGQSRGEVAGLCVVAPPVAADVVAIAAVPLGPPQARERAHLVSPSRIPGLGDDLRVGEHRIFRDQFDDRRIRQDVAVAVAAEHARQVEAEAVDVVVVHPMSQAEEDQLADDRVIAVDRVAAAGVVAVVAGVAEHVIDAVLQPLERQRGPEVVALGSVVEDDVEDHLDAGSVESPHHLLEFSDLAARLLSRRVPAVGGEEGHRVVAPVVELLGPGSVGQLGWKLVHRHEFHGGHAQRLEVRDLFDHAQIGARMADAAGRAGREAADVHFVDHGVGQSAPQVPVPLPVERVVDHHALRRPDDAVGAR